VKSKHIRITIATAVLTTAAGGVALWRAAADERVVQPTSSVTSRPKATAPERLAALPTRDPIGKPRGEPFDSRSWAPPAPRSARTVVEAPPKPVAPAVPYRIAGEVTHDGAARVVLAQGERIFSVAEGETIDNVYRVESIKSDGVTLVYLPLNERQQVQVVGLLLDLSLPGAVAGASARPSLVAADADGRPAQLRWEGPREVHAGANFDVTLKLTSAQPVRALPLQVSYDAKLVEPIAVRPGGLFADGRFTYRVGPGGSIFVGASTNDSAPADADLMVVTFRPIRSGDAELKLSSVALQGVAGRAIAHEAPATFRTAILQ
jgi:cohesin domain-containing protein